MAANSILPFYHVISDPNCGIGNYSIRFFSLSTSIPCTATAYDYFVLILWLMFFAAVGFIVWLIYGHLKEQVGMSRQQAIKSFLLVAVILILAFFVIFEAVEIYQKQRMIYQQTYVIKDTQEDLTDTAELLEEVRKEMIALRELIENKTFEAEAPVVVEEEVKSKWVPATPDEEEVVNKTFFDYDKDGLSIDEEDALGTSDYKADTDEDGLNDKDDPNPRIPGDIEELSYEFEYEDLDVEINVTYNSDYFEYLNNRPLNLTKTDYFTPNDPVIKQIAKQLMDFADNNSLRDEYLVALAFYQSLDFVEDGHEGVDYDVKFPLQTLVHENGDSEDLSLLLASLFKAVGEHVVLLYYKDHAAVGVDCFKCGGKYFDIDGDKYYYVEPVSDDLKIGRVPDEYYGQKVRVLFLG